MTRPASPDAPEPEGSGPLSKTALSRAKRKTSGAAPAAQPSTDRGAADAALRIVLASLDDMKAEDTLTIDLAGKSALADYMVIASGRSQRHVASIADDVAKKLKQGGIRSMHSEGKQNADWVLIDAGDVIVHVFRPETRAFYNLEKMWSPHTSSSKRPG